MTIAEYINDQVLRLDLAHLTAQEREWLHGIRTLATIVYINQWRREHRKGD